LEKLKGHSDLDIGEKPKLQVFDENNLSPTQLKRRLKLMKRKAPKRHSLAEPSNAGTAEDMTRHRELTHSQ